MPFSWFSLNRRSARSFTDATKKIFNSAFGSTTVPISRPSIMMEWFSAISRCICTSFTRTALIAETSDTFRVTSRSRISRVTSSPFKKTSWPSSVFLKLMTKFSSNSSIADASSTEILFLKNANVVARYIAPVSR